VTIGATGRENQLAGAIYPRWAFTLSYGGNSWLREQTQNITTDPTLAGYTELEQLSSLYLACLGPYGEFYYTDVDDCSRLSQFIGIGNNSQTTFPLYFSWGTGPFSPSLTFPVQGIASLDAVYIGGSLQSPSSYSLDSTKTQIIFTSPPIEVYGNITADFHFYYRCRFLDDNMSYNQFDRNLWETKEVRFESVKP
jgi:uncharacterized protein (TIGR02217 family)